MAFLAATVEEEKLWESGGRKLSRTSDGLLLRRPNHFGSRNGGSEKVRDKRCGRNKLNRGSADFDIGREKDSPTAMAEENSLWTHDGNINTHR